MAIATPSAAEVGRGETATAAQSRRSSSGAEAARYGVLRRLGPALKHDMVVNLQAIAMMTEVLQARLDRGAPDPSEFNSSISKLNRLAREAVANCLNVAAWIEPGEDEGVRLADGVEDCLALLDSNFNFRGFLVTRELAQTPFQVSRVALRNLLIGSLVTLTDAAGGPCQVKVRSTVDSGYGEIEVRIAPRSDGCEGLPFELSYRQLEWSDVQALAQAEGVELMRGSDYIFMRMPRHVAMEPLRIAAV